MNSEWASHNLQRQRQLLEERQRQRRMQTGGILSSGAGRPPVVSYSTNPSSLLTRSPSASGFQDDTTKFLSQRERSTTNLYKNGGSFNVADGLSTSNSLYSLSKAHLNDGKKETSSMVYHPKVITVKGFTPHEPRTWANEFQNDQYKNADVLSVSKTPQKPGIDRLDRLNLNDPVRSENRDENLKNLISTPPQRCELWEEIDKRKRNGNANTSTVKEHNATIDNELDSLPTEVIVEESPIDVVEILTNLEHFVMLPMKKNTTLRCTITRDKKGMDKGMFPCYYAHWEKTDGKRIFLMAARRRKKSKTANYLISIDPTDLSRGGENFIAKIRSNAVGTEFTIYDKGGNPKKASVIGDGIRQELAAIIYDANFLGLNGPRKMKIIIPSVEMDEKHNISRSATIRPISEKDTILERYKSHRLAGMIMLKNREPVWNEESQSYVLNFLGRVSQASVKNFQIIPDEEEEQASHFFEPQTIRHVMQFGRSDNEGFTMDVRFPLSPIQAFGIAMTSFHKKLACD